MLMKMCVIKKQTPKAKTQQFKNKLTYIFLTPSKASVSSPLLGHCLVDESHGWL